MLSEKKHLFKFPGAEAYFYIAMYAFERMIVEGLRTDSLYLGPVRVSQLLSVLALLVVSMLCFSKNKKRMPLIVSSGIAFFGIFLSILYALPYPVLIVSAAAALSVCLIHIFSFKGAYPEQ